MGNLLFSCTLPVLPISSIGCSLAHVRATPGVADDAVSTLLRTSSQLCHGQSATLIHSAGASVIFNRLLSCACPCNFRCSRCLRVDSSSRIGLDVLRWPVCGRQAACLTCVRLLGVAWPVCNMFDVHRLEPKVSCQIAHLPSPAVDMMRHWNCFGVSLCILYWIWVGQFDSTVLLHLSSWYCLLHLLYTKDTNALPALQVQTPTAPPPSGPSQVGCRNFRFQSDSAMQLTKANFFCNIYHNLPGRKKKRKRRRRRQSNAESPNPRGSTDNIKEADSSFERRTRRHRWRWTMLMVKNTKITLSFAVQLWCCRSVPGTESDRRHVPLPNLWSFDDCFQLTASNVCFCELCFQRAWKPGSPWGLYVM